MTASLCLPQQFKVVQLASPETTNGGKTSDAISCKHAHKVWLIIELTQAVGHATTFTPMQATDVAIGTNAVVPAQNIWLNTDCGATDTLVKQTSAANLAVAADVKDKTVIFEFDPATFTAGYDCLYVIAADSSQANNFWSVTAIIMERFAQATPPAAITD